MLPTKFQVNWPFGSGGEAKNRLSRWLSRRPSWISDRNDFPYFWSTSHHYASYEFLVNWLFGSWKEVKTRFSRWHHGGHPGLPIETILAIFDLQATPMLPTKFQVNGPSGVGGVVFLKQIVDAARRTTYIDRSQ